MRGYAIAEQLKLREHCEINGDGVINIGLSQETENMFQNDYSFIEKLQEDQKNACLDVRESNEAIVEEQVVIVREAVNAIDNDTDLLNKLTIELREILNKYKLLSTNKKRKGTNDDIVFPITGKCTKIYDKRKGHY